MVHAADEVRPQLHEMPSASAWLAQPLQPLAASLCTDCTDTCPHVRNAVSAETAPFNPGSAFNMPTWVAGAEPGAHHIAAGALLEAHPQRARIVQHPLFITRPHELAVRPAPWRRLSGCKRFWQVAERCVTLQACNCLDVRQYGHKPELSWLLTQVACGAPVDAAAMSSLTSRRCITGSGWVALRQPVPIKRQASRAFRCACDCHLSSPAWPG